jgi:GTP pyrophosphokinase
VSKLRFEFERADPSHLDSLLAPLRGIDSVYEAYRVVPGQGG